jgi:hypothetical protein
VNIDILTQFPPGWSPARQIHEVESLSLWSPGTEQQLTVPRCYCRIEQLVSVNRVCLAHLHCCRIDRKARVGAPCGSFRADALTQYYLVHLYNKHILSNFREAGLQGL